jgi:hypothetical protein
MVPDGLRASAGSDHAQPVGQDHGLHPVALALRRREYRSGGISIVLLVAAVCIVVALGVPVDPWHDLGMFGLFGCWVVLGLRLAGVRSRAPMAVRQ